MKFFGKKGNEFKEGFFNKRKGLKITLIVVALLLIIGGTMAWKAGKIFNKVSTNGGFFKNLINVIPGVNTDLNGEQEDRINILILGMRGENVPGGGTLADTIIMASVKPKENKISMISIPRDFYVDNPALGTKSKINAVYAYAEKNSKGQGIEDMKKVIGDVTGLPIHYGAVINFEGFSDLVDAIGGVDITLENPFDESQQFNQAHVCDSFFNVPTGQFETKTKKYFSNDAQEYKTRVVATYPLCTAPVSELECGGNFTLPAGPQTLSGEKALCYVRSRYTSSDFDRAKRQQQIIRLVKEKLLSAGTLTDFGKINDILDSLGNNVQTDMQLWEMKRIFSLYQGMNNPQMYQRVLENSNEGLLYNPPAESNPGAGYILLPIGDNYDKIREMAQNIFSLPEQSDIKPK
ncbi:MAG: cell envelope-like protein transcriptional attenuator [uncultured bacterium]|nr:MAG: cell envelope-like protein transcriptional attenuator [uncultured bacterium]HBR71300.1 hypothetical protein [Candidatus Moranbacteria bacterium]